MLRFGTDSGQRLPREAAQICKLWAGKKQSKGLFSKLVDSWVLKVVDGVCAV
jgi:hypothetical protein